MKRTAQKIEEAKEAKASETETPEPKRNKRGNLRGMHPNTLAAARRNKGPHFPKGVSGNPGGLPGVDMAALIARRTFEQDSESVAEGMAAQLRKGNAYAFSVLADRGYGKVKEKHEVTGADGDPLAITIKLVKTNGSD
jgi:hypothetical protein